MVSLWQRFIAFILGISKSAEGAAELSSGQDTEFMAEVVRITAIEPHPHADRLELARIESAAGPLGYELVIQKGSFRVGDLAGYFSVDCVVPTAHPAFAFLRDRLDGAGKEHYRLRAARLRGVFSQGLLVNLELVNSWKSGPWEVGDNLAGVGVTYYRTETEEPRGPTPPGKKRPSRDPWPHYGVDSVKKNPRLFAVGEEVVITEKIHGCNFRFGWVRRKILGIPFGWVFRVGSHRAMKGQLATGVGYYGDDVWADFAEQNDLAERTRDYPGWTFYGELYGYTPTGKKLQDLTYSVPHGQAELVVFDVRNPEGQWVPPFERAVVLADTSLPEVPVLYRGPLFVGWERMAEGLSTIDNKTQREGVVVEADTGPRKKGKYVGTGYLLRETA